MAPSNPPSKPLSKAPSIQSFYKREVQVQTPNTAIDATPTPTAPGDGFSAEEKATALDPSLTKWEPTREYTETGIAELEAGPKAVMFVGRVVNVTTILGQNPKEPKARGWHYVLLGDGGGVVSIKIFFANKPFPVRLGVLMTVWTAFVSESATTEVGNVQGVRAYANLFPGRVTSDHVMAHEHSEGTKSACRGVIGYRKGEPLAGLMTLSSYTTSGHDDIPSAKILVCVKSIGARRTIANKTGGESELVDVWLFDHTGEIRWSVWNDLIPSAKEWVSGTTILLISNPGFKVGRRNARGSLGITKDTWVDVDPEFPDAEWLRRYAEGRTRKESMRQEWPEGVWDVQAAEYGVNVILFTLAGLDEWVRVEPRRVFTGHINVTIMEMSLVTKHYQNMLMCSQCCGVPVYANTRMTTCRNCSKLLTLALNPRIVGMLLDEAGCIGGGKLLWSERAWEQLLGRSVEEVTKMTTDEIRLLEQRMVYLRMHLVVGWEESVGKLAVLGMRA
ncbi:hypothetical protein BJ878DRAFT_455587 [Calycina marina]|uniref:Uncharacterized protein n=1 Tax=Calycina marina TaxID=1763456 RepID=A0A9P7Z702_9HELO|nr:hypothetical protein BJ878DRAFT_455587 [Calycina marina]